MKNKKIVALIDYKGRFGSKHFDKPYRSGMDKKLLTKLFLEDGYELEFIPFHEFDLIISSEAQVFLYTSSEDIGYHYKSYIEDVIFALEQSKFNVIPKYEYLKATNNKTLMEMLRKVNLEKSLNNPLSYSFGTYEELMSKIDIIKFPAVFKKSAGASGSGVYLAKDKKEIEKIVKRESRTKNLAQDYRDLLRSFRHKGYKRESLYRSKFVVQNLIPDLKNDWKIYFFGHKLYVFNRPILKGRGIKASGGGYDNYLFDENSKVPKGLFDYALEIYKSLDTPHISLDIAYDGYRFYLIEYQSLYFGTAGIPYSKGYYESLNNSWNFVDKVLSIEKVYVDSIIEYLNK